MTNKNDCDHTRVTRYLDMKENWYYYRCLDCGNKSENPPPNYKDPYTKRTFNVDEGEE